MENRGEIDASLSFPSFRSPGIGRENVGEKDDKGDGEAKHVRDACFNRRYQYDSSPSNPLYPPLMEQSSDCTKNRCVTETIPTMYL